MSTHVYAEAQTVLCPHCANPTGHKAKDYVSPSTGLYRPPDRSHTCMFCDMSFVARAGSEGYVEIEPVRIYDVKPED